MDLIGRLMQHSETVGAALEALVSNERSGQGRGCLADRQR
jgi:hypothetical protein